MDAMCIDDWERDFAKALLGLDAKSVLVEFSRDGSSAAGKLKLNDIIREFLENGSFSDYNFATYDQGYKVVKKLCPNGSCLTCKDISKITFRGKTIFER